MCGHRVPPVTLLCALTGVVVATLLCAVTAALPVTLLCPVTGVLSETLSESETLCARPIRLGCDLAMSSHCCLAVTWLYVVIALLHTIWLCDHSCCPCPCCGTSVAGCGTVAVTG